jgi:FkbM family methyltransferase
MEKLPIEYVENRKKYILFKNDCGVTDMARRGDIYEHYIFDYIKENIDVKGKNIIDIGANFGFHTLEFAEFVDTGNVYSFEPQKLIYYQLCGNVIINGYSNVTTYNIALSDSITIGKIENQNYFSEAKINIGDSHLNAFTNNGFNEVEVRTLDSFNFENVSIIKIDVQGCEPRVLDGAKNTILRNNPIIFIEIEDSQLEIYGWNKNDIFNRLDALGYTYKKVIDAEHLMDYVAIPKSKYLNFFDGVYYINLDDKPDRKELFEKRSKVHDIDAIRFPGIVPKEGEYEQLINEFDERRKFKVGCSLSHQAIIREAKEKNYNNVLIFEDDCVFSEDFKEIAQKYVNELKTIDWNLMYFGGEPNNYCKPITNNLSIVQNTGGVWCTHAYAVNHKFYDIFLSWDANKIPVIDVYLASLNTNVIVGYKPIAFQDETFSDLWGKIILDKKSNSIIEWEKYVSKKVSFICTSYRRFRCVERIVAQYNAQTYLNKELIIFNTDEEYPIELGFEDKNIIIINNSIDYKTGTPYESRGQICRDAVTHATGYYFMLADDDDIYMPWHMQQAVEGIEELGTDAWKPEASLFALTEKIQLSQNVMEASIIVKMNRIREIGFRTDVTGYEGLSWVMKLKDEGQLDEHNKNYIPSYCFNWSDPYDMGGHKQSSFIDSLNNFENHKLSSTDIANRKLVKLSEEDINNVYEKYYNFIESNLDILNMIYYERYAKKFINKI